MGEGGGGGVGRMRWRKGRDGYRRCRSRACLTVEVVFIVSSGDVDVTVLALVGGEEVAVTAIVSRATREVEVESDIDERLDDSDVDVAIAGTGVDDEVAFAQ